MPYTPQHKERYNQIIELENKLSSTYTYSDLKELIMGYFDVCCFDVRKNAGFETLLTALMSRCIQLEKRNIGLEISQENA